jgi:hypothetical protein
MIAIAAAVAGAPSSRRCLQWLLAHRERSEDPTGQSKLQVDGKRPGAVPAKAVVKELSSTGA